MDKEIRISLGLEDFAKLVRGQVIERQSAYAQGPIKIAIQDIGFIPMQVEIQTAWEEFSRVGHTEDVCQRAPHTGPCTTEKSQGGSKS